ncbi:helix-turn-helix transcriptional regulator [Allorhizobium sp. BGMRC 0089]|nr:helix-turn-helix transcriptional regulator [Allorhizobium sonneratiae]
MPNEILSYKAAPNGAMTTHPAQAATISPLPDGEPSSALASGSALGQYLKDCRARLDPSAFGFSSARRRTPGLRREEVALIAHISPTWYTWLEQGRGGAPSTDVLERLARALMLTDAERDHLYLLGLGHLPHVRYQPDRDISPRLQRVLDALDESPALIKNATWDILAWNRAAAAVLTDYATLPVQERNVMRLMFCRHSDVPARQAEWLKIARFVIAIFRSETARLGITEAVQPMVEELSRESAEFAALWRENSVSNHGGGVKELLHPHGGRLTLEYSAFGIDGRPDLAMLVYQPVSDADRDAVRALMDEHAANMIHSSKAVSER